MATRGFQSRNTSYRLHSTRGSQGPSAMQKNMDFSSEFPRKCDKPCSQFKH